MHKHIDVLIIDDEPVSRTTLQSYLSTSYGEALNIVGEAASGAEAYKAIRTLNPDVVFLDVHMPDINGFELLGRFKPSDFLTVVCSADERQALQAMNSNALYFLSKPLAVNEIDRCVNRLLDAVQEKIEQSIPEGRRKIELYSGGRTHFVPMNDILYIEASGSYSVVYRENGSRLVVSRNLKSLLTELSDTLFCRIHNSYIVNLSKVASCSFNKHSCMLDSGKEVRMAIRRTDEMRERLSTLWSSYRSDEAPDRSSENPTVH